MDAHDSLALIRRKMLTVCSIIVVPPEGPYNRLPTDIPDGEVDVLVGDRLHVETDGWDGDSGFTQLQSIQHGGFTGGVETHHEDPHVAFEVEETLPYGGKYETHVDEAKAKQITVLNKGIHFNYGMAYNYGNQH